MKNALKIFFISILLFGCKKEYSVNGPSTNDRIKEISTLYIEKHASLNTANKPPKWLRVLGADLSGALTGAGIGAGVGAATGVGAGAGAIVGAVVGGASSSIKEASANNISGQEGVNGTGNTNNPYDFVGYHHYAGIDAAFSAGDNYLVNGAYSNSTFYVYIKNYLLSNSVCDTLHFGAFTTTHNDENLSFVNQHEDLSNEEFVDLLYTEDLISSDVKDILVSYYQCLEVAADTEDFTDYSIDAEDIVVSSTSLSAIDKQIILSLMATARYGLDYWSTH